MRYCGFIIIKNTLVEGDNFLSNEFLCKNRRNVGIRIVENKTIRD